MRRTVLAFLAVLAASSTLAQQPQQPAQKKAPQDFFLKNATTPERLNADIEATAKKAQSSAPRPRLFQFRFYRPRDAAEFEAVARYTLMLITVVTRTPAELPVQVAYIRTPSDDIQLIKISNWRSELDGSMLAAQVYGRHREDGFYLLPTTALFRDGQILLDLGAKQLEMPLLQLPSKAVASSADRLPMVDPAPDARPNLKALQGYLARNFPGFPMPKALP